MKIYRPSPWCKILAWLLFSAFGIKLLCNLNCAEPFVKLISVHPEHYGPAPERHEEPHGTKEPPPEDEPNEHRELEQLLRSNEQYNWSHDDQGQCAPYPRVEDLRIENEYFQHTEGGNVSYYLYSAYYDRRLALEWSPSIIILGMTSSISGPFTDAYCQVWYEHSSKPELLKMQRQHFGWYDYWGNGPDHVYPVLFTCPLVDIARRHRVPQLVSLVFDERCSRPTNALRVFYDAPKRRRTPRFGVCLKCMQTQTDISERLVEWFELMRLLGVERVISYDLGGETLVPNTRRTLRHYTKQEGLLQLRPYQLLEGHPKPAANRVLNNRLNEVLMYNDCLYRNMYEFDYLAVIDMDEVIMPLGALHNWTALVERLESNCNGNLNTESINPTENCEARCSFCFRNVYFSRELAQDETAAPTSFYMLRHVQRVAKHLNKQLAIKCLHATAYVTLLHNHFPFEWREACGPHDVATSIGQMQHYREPANVETLRVPPPVRDANIWRFRERLISNSQAVHRQLGWSLP